jgi:glutathione S-transferase
MSNRMGCITDEMVNLKGYVNRISERPCFKIAIEME